MNGLTNTSRIYVNSREARPILCGYFCAIGHATRVPFVAGTRGLRYD